MEEPQTVERLRAALRGSSLVRDVSVTDRGHGRVQTAFVYPDGSALELFLANRFDLLQPLSAPLLTDFGNSFAWLMDLGIFPMRTKRRAKLVGDILETYNVHRNGGALETEIRAEDYADAIIRLSQACIRVTDLSFTQRMVSRGRFNEEFEEFLSDLEADYTPDFEIALPTGNILRVDFKVQTRRAPVAVMTLPSEGKVRSLAKQRAEHVFATFYDLQKAHWDGELLAAVDDRAEVYDASDMGRIQDIANVISFGDQAALGEFLRAA